MLGPMPEFYFFSSQGYSLPLVVSRKGLYMAQWLIEKGGGAIMFDIQVIFLRRKPRDFVPRVLV
jgi:hypothetical protein